MQHAESDPRYHTGKIKQMLSDTMVYLREDEGKIAEPKARALVETTAEVLGGLVKAYDDYEQGKPAWR